MQTGCNLLTVLSQCDVTLNTKVDWIYTSDIHIYFKLKSKRGEIASPKVKTIT
jgi:hypothetical protein